MIQTSGIFAKGIYAQSIGGGGGDGGWAGGIVGIGGDGSYASSGGNIEVYNYGNILTTGIFSDAIFTESIGGGGGSGAGSGGLVSIGGTGAGGGDAGDIRIENAGDINTTGLASRGIVAQDRRGRRNGAGSGGWVSLGGDGGTSGTAGTIDIINSGWIRTSMAGSIGIFAQSIGGGGGSGAGSGGWFTSIGGDGGASGDGNTVTIINSGVIITDGNSSKASMPKVSAAAAEMQAVRGHYSLHWAATAERQAMEAR